MILQCAACPIIFLHRDDFAIRDMPEAMRDMPEAMRDMPEAMRDVPHGAET